MASIQNNVDFLLFHIYHKCSSLETAKKFFPPLYLRAQHGTSVRGRVLTTSDVRTAEDKVIEHFKNAALSHPKPGENQPKHKSTLGISKPTGSVPQHVERPRDPGAAGPALPRQVELACPSTTSANPALPQQVALARPSSTPFPQQVAQRTDATPVQQPRPTTAAAPPRALPSSNHPSFKRLDIYDRIRVTLNESSSVGAETHHSATYHQVDSKTTCQQVDSATGHEVPAPSPSFSSKERPAVSVKCDKPAQGSLKCEDASLWPPGIVQRAIDEVARPIFVDAFQKFAAATEEVSHDILEAQARMSHSSGSVEMAQLTELVQRLKEERENWVKQWLAKLAQSGVKLERTVSVPEIVAQPTPVPHRVKPARTCTLNVLHGSSLSKKRLKEKSQRMKLSRTAKTNDTTFGGKASGRKSTMARKTRPG